jgi:hypothetical protein
MNYDEMKEYIYNRLKEIAGKRQLISYGQLLREVGIDPIESWEKNRHGELRSILGDISLEEHSRGNPLLSAVVVHQDGDQMPGDGFFKELLKQIGRQPIYGDEERLTFWVNEVNNLQQKWGSGNLEI